jgi:hypothetical protein
VVLKEAGGNDTSSSRFCLHFLSPYTAARSLLFLVIVVDPYKLRIFSSTCRTSSYLPSSLHGVRTRNSSAVTTVMRTSSNITGSSSWSSCSHCSIFFCQTSALLLYTDKAGSEFCFLASFPNALAISFYRIVIRLVFSVLVNEFLTQFSLSGFSRISFVL